jgi:hypothetical protein
MGARPAINESLFERLHAAEVYEEFTALMFDQRMHYEELLEQLEKWGISSSLGALSRFKVSQRGPWAMERAKREEKEFLADNGAELDETTRKLVAMRIFQDAASPETTTKDVLRMKDQEIQMAKLKQDAVKLGQAERKLSQAQELIDLQKRKIEALEEQATAARLAAEKAKDAIKSGGMDDATRAMLIEEMDRMILGTTAAAKKQQEAT